MKFLHLLIFFFLILGLQSCKQSESHSVDLPIAGGIQVAIHESGGQAALNDTIQISDHWQLSSVGRRHGWMRKLDVAEQKELVKALHNFSSLQSFSEDETETMIVAKGTGEGHGTPEDAEALSELIKKFVGAKRIASR